MDRRVVITGIGTINPFGAGRSLLWEGVANKQSALSLSEEVNALTLPILAAGFVKDFQPAKFVKHRKSLKVMCRDIQMAVVASCLAREDAGLEESDYNPHRAGTCIGAGIFEHDPEEMSDSFKAALEGEGFNTHKFGSDGMGQLFPLWLLKYLPNMPACHITISHNLQGPSNTITADSAGSASAIEESVRIIQRGTADIMFCGGAESRIYGVGLMRYHSEGILKNGDGNPLEYPVFSESSKGVIPGEGGAILILEELEHALKRGARIYAEIKGFGSTSNFTDDEVVRGDLQKKTMQESLKRALLENEEVDGLYLSSKGVLSEDKVEASSIKSVFSGENRPELMTARPLMGFLGYAALPTEMAIAAMSLREGSIGPLITFEDHLLKEFASLQEERKQKPRVFMINHFENGLTNHSFVLQSLGNDAP